MDDSLNIISSTDTDRIRLSRVLVALYRGVLYRDDSEDLWNDMTRLQARAQDHFTSIGLSLFIVEAEGFAYVRYPSSSLDNEAADEGAAIPRLVAKRQLTYQTSLLLALMRKRMAEFEAGGEGTRLVMTRDEIVEMVGIFLPEGGNEAKIMDGVEKNINKIRDMGFVRSLKNQSNVYEVLGIIKAFVDAEWLGVFEKQLDEYRRIAGVGAASPDGDD